MVVNTAAPSLTPYLEKIRAEGRQRLLQVQRDRERALAEEKEARQADLLALVDRDLHPLRPWVDPESLKVPRRGPDLEEQPDPLGLGHEVMILVPGHHPLMAYYTWSAGGFWRRAPAPFGALEQGARRMWTVCFEHQAVPSCCEDLGVALALAWINPEEHPGF